MNFLILTTLLSSFLILAAQAQFPSFVGPRFNLERPNQNEQTQQLDYYEDSDSEVEEEAEEDDQEDLIECPNSVEVKSCDNKCSTDNECKGTKICCKHSCGTMCFLPRFRNNQASPASSYKQTDISTEDKEEPLKVTLECPKLNLTDTNRTCVRTRFTCQNDNDCDSLEKCCEYKCGKKCIGLGIEQPTTTTTTTTESYDYEQKPVTRPINRRVRPQKPVEKVAKYNMPGFNPMNQFGMGQMNPLGSFMSPLSYNPMQQMFPRFNFQKQQPDYSEY